MALTWRGRRQVLYYTVAAVLGFLLLVVVSQILFSRSSTCSDGTQNGSERGVDCGGSCLKICPAEARAPVVLWARSFQVSPSSYSAVAYVENRNINAGAENVRYSFQLFDERNVLVVERVGTLDIPPVTLVPIVESAIPVGNRSVVRTQFSFASADIPWERNPKELPLLRVSEQELEGDASKLTATLTNNSVIEARDVRVVAVLFDAEGVARGSSQTTISRLGRHASTPLVFTWPQGVAQVVRAEITVLPSL